MEYEGQICRAPMERASYMLPVMVGCSYGRCRFCNLFRHLRFRVLPMGQVEAEMQRVKDLGGHPKKIFLGDGNAFDLPTRHLMEILEKVEEYFPDREAVNMDATVTGILKKSDEELSRLYEKGVQHLYLGIETGLDDVLKFMEKDHSLSQAYEAIERLHRAGLIYDAHIMTGVAGKGRSLENAEALAEFFRETHPAHVVNFSMFLHKEVPLYESIEDGSFPPADELECLREERRLIELLAEDAADQPEIKYEGFHDYIGFRVRGKLPRDGERMLTKLDQAIQKYEKEEPVYPYVYGECPELVKCGADQKLWDMSQTAR